MSENSEDITIFPLLSGIYSNHLVKHYYYTRHSFSFAFSDLSNQCFRCFHFAVVMQFQSLSTFTTLVLCSQLEIKLVFLVLLGFDYIL